MAQVKKVKLYYLGFPGVTHMYVNAYGTSFKVPPVGEYIEIESYYAKAIMRKFNIYQSAVWSFDARMANTAKSKRGDEDTNSDVKLVQRAFTREELQAMLASMDAIQSFEDEPDDLLTTATTVVNTDKGDVKSSSKGK